MLKSELVTYLKISAKCGEWGCHECHKTFTQFGNDCGANEIVRLHREELMDLAERLEQGKGQLSSEIDPEEILSMLEEG